MRQTTAFTLVELMVVLGLMVFLAGTVAWSSGKMDGKAASSRANALAVSGFIRLAQDDARTHGQPVRVLAEPFGDEEGAGWRLTIVRRRESEAVVWDRAGQSLPLPDGLRPVTNPGDHPAWRGPEAMPVGDEPSRAVYYFELDQNGSPISGAGRVAFAPSDESGRGGEVSAGTAAASLWISSGGEVSLY